MSLLNEFKFIPVVIIQNKKNFSSGRKPLLFQVFTFFTESIYPVYFIPVRIFRF